MERYSEYSVEFNRKFDPEKRQLDPLPVRSITVTVVAKDISDAMCKAWDVVRVTPEEYEIDQISRFGSSWQRFK